MAPCRSLGIATEANSATFQEGDRACLPPEAAAPVVLIFDIEELHRIEAAAGRQVELEIKGNYHNRMCRATEWILTPLDLLQIRVTFFFLGEIAKSTGSCGQFAKLATKCQATAGIIDASMS